LQWLIYKRKEDGGREVKKSFNIEKIKLVQGSKVVLELDLHGSTRQGQSTKKAKGFTGGIRRKTTWGKKRKKVNGDLNHESVIGSDDATNFGGPSKQGPKTDGKKQGRIATKRLTA